MPTTSTEILKNASLYTDNELYVVLKLPAAAITPAASIIAELGEPFCALIVDKDEVTLVVPHDVPVEFGARLRGHEAIAYQYRLITIDAVLPPDLVGFMAKISAALADAGVTLLPYAAFSRDHLLVPEAQFETAMAALQKLKGS
jgi:hypothetical protein